MPRQQHSHFGNSRHQRQSQPQNPRLYPQQSGQNRPQPTGGCGSISYYKKLILWLFLQDGYKTTKLAQNKVCGENKWHLPLIHLYWFLILGFLLALAMPVGDQRTVRFPKLAMRSFSYFTAL